MLRGCYLFVIAILSAGVALEAAAQTTYRALIPQMEAHRVSLERAWFTRVRVDPARGRVAHVTQHVSSTRAYTVYEVTHDLGKSKFSERDLDRFGDPLGKDGAKRLAERYMRDLNLQQQHAKLTVHTVPEISLFVMTNLGMVQAIDAETGRTRWTTPVGNPFYHSEAPGANDEYVAVVNGSSIVVMDQSNGKIVWRRQARGAPGAGPAVTDLAVFVPMLDGIVESYQLLDHRRAPRILQSHGRAMIQPIYTGKTVAWPTDRGHLNVAEEERSKMRFRLETNSQIEAPATSLAPGRLLTVSADGYMYCISEVTGSLSWRFSTGEPISQAPVVVGDSIYVITDDRSLYRVSAHTGIMEWSSSGVRGFLAASQNRLYCSGSTGRLLVLDASNGSHLASLATEALDLRISNHDTDRIFLGSRHGVIQCLHEVRQEWPHIHAGVLEDRPADEPAAAGGAEAEAKPPAGSEGEDPFGTADSPAESEDDPFGGDSSDDPFGGDTGSDDPFGGDAGDGDPFGGDSSGDDLF